ncbi:unnamed protein product [Peronospora destructor]|uniref:NAD(+) ADP-ribosyltransferase n=1 Tax=Peronospora destructor TaxID=86335 RepID=A0AAV0T864_9STRA|nr:unnamed protein product [Peronospora destructor]
MVSQGVTKRVDPLSGCDNSAKVYQDANGIAWSFMLNYTNISSGTYGYVVLRHWIKWKSVFILTIESTNNNFYMVQLIQNGADYMVFCKWGRVGKEPAASSGALQHVARKGAGLLHEQSSIEEVQEEEKNEAMSETETKEEVASSLAETVQDVLKLICDADMVAREVASMHLDLKRLPLDKLSKAQIRQGYAILQQLSAAVKEIDELGKIAANLQDTALEKQVETCQSTRVKGSAHSHVAQLRRLNNSLKTLSSDFYTLIPHDFGRDLPTSLDSLDKIKLKIDLLEVLTNLETSQELEAEKKKERRRRSMPS